MSRLLNKLTWLGLGMAVIGGTANAALYNVDAGHRAVIFSRVSGVLPDVVSEGTHFLIPLVHRPIIFDIRSRPRNVPVSTGSKDMQTVNITLRILVRPEEHQLPHIWQTLGVDYDEKVLPSITTEVLKAVVAKFDAVEMITQREIVSKSVSEALNERANSFNIILEDISLTHLSFGKEFADAVEQKQVAQQEAERARFLVEKAEQQKRAAILTAEGDTKAAELLAKSFAGSGEGLIELRKIEAAEDITHQLATSRGVVWIPNNQNMLLNLPTGAPVQQ